MPRDGRGAGEARNILLILTPSSALSRFNEKLTAGVPYSGPSYTHGFRGILALTLLSVIALMGCGTTVPPPMGPDQAAVSWAEVDSLNVLLPAGLRMYSFTDESAPLRAWYVRAAPGTVEPQVVMASDTTDNRQSVFEMASNAGACVAINAGYFTMNETPARHVGLLMLSDTLHTAATEFQLGDERIGRAAILFEHDAPPLISWPVNRDTALVAVIIDGESVETLGRVQPGSGVGAGPMLLQDGRVTITSDAEGFGNTSIPAVHPRTAAGVTSDGSLVLMVVDGRQDASRGVDLHELAVLMQSAGAIDALNLDGGGSSTLVVAGQLINRPTGGTFQREVMSAILLQCN